MRENRFKKYILGIEYLPYILVVLAVVLPWLFHSGYLFFTDLVVGPNMSVNLFQSSFAQNLLIKIFSLFHFFAFGQKVFIGLTLLIVLLGAKKLLEYFTDQKWLVFILSLFFLFNPFVYDRVMYGQFGIPLSLGLLTWGLGFLLEFLKEKKTLQLVYVGILWGLSIAFCLQAMFFVGLVFLIGLICLMGGKSANRLKTILKSILIVGAMIVIFNLNWMIGSFVGKSSLNSFVSQGIGHQDLIAFQTIGEGEWGTIDNVLMMSGFWGKEQNRYVDLTKIRESWGRSFYILLLLVLLGVYVGLRDKKYRILSISLIVLFLISVFLAVGIKVTGAREASIWLFDHFPFYHGFREPQKWVMLIVLVYGGFLALGAKRFFKAKIVEKNKVLVSIILGAVIVFQAPMLLWGFGGQIQPINYPKDWQEADRVIKLESYKVESGRCDKKILFFPWHMYLSFPWSKTVSANPAGVFFTCDTIVGTNMEWGGIDDNSLSPEGKLVPEWLATGGRTDLLKNPEFNIGYIVLAKTLDWDNYNWLDNYPFVEKIQDTENLKVYHVK